MSGLSGFERLFHRFMIAQLAYQDDLGRLMHRGTQRQRKAGRIAVQFPLVNGCSFVCVQKLNWVFDGENVAGAMFVDAVQKRSQY